jgi:hypothetical protein
VLVVLILLLVDIPLVYHACKTGRARPWAFIILMVPLVRIEPVGDALATLDDLQKRWPDFQSSDAHLLYARSLAEVGRLDEALEEYHAVSAYFPGAEARVRYGLLLRMVGRTAEARIVFNELLLQMQRAPKYLRDAQVEWLAIAEKQLSG